MESIGWETILTYIETLGWAKGVFTIFFFLAHYWIFKSYKGRLDDRQKEIDRIALDNSEYRKRFMTLLDNKLLESDKKDSKAIEKKEEK